MRVKKLITPQQWIEKLDAMSLLAETWGARVHIVAPDKLFDPEGTLQRMRDAAPMIQRIVRFGAEVLVPLVPRPGQTLVQAFQTAAEAMGVNKAQLVPAIPMRWNKKRKRFVTDPRDVVAFVAEYQPVRLHLLGMGETNSAFDKLFADINQASKHTWVSVDSAKAPAGACRPSSTRKIGRLTAGRDEAEAQLQDECYFGGGDSRTLTPDFTEAFIEMNSWTTKKDRVALAKNITKGNPSSRRPPSDVFGTKREKQQFIDDPETYLQQHTDDESLSIALYEAVADLWRTKFYELSTAERVRRGIIKAFGGRRR